MTLDQPACVLIAEPTWGAVLHAARSLGSMGVPVYVATLGTGSDVFRRSRWIRAAQDFQPDSDRVVEEIAKWLDQVAVGGGPVPVLALSDQAAELLDAARDRLPPRYRPVLPESSAFEPLLSKVDSARLAQQAGLNVPDWVAVSSDEDIAAVDRLSFPVVIRPDTWTMPGSEVDKVELLEDFPSASERLSELVDHGTSVVVSEFVTAPVEAVEFGILWRSLSGTATVVCTGRKRRQDGSGGGVMAWGEAVDLPDVRQEAMRFLDTSGFQGVGGIEFICSGGKLWFIEFNPRLEAIHFLGTRAGVDTVCLAYRDAALDERPTQQPVQVPATAWVGSAWAHRLRIDPGDWRLALRDRVAFARSQRRVRAVLSGRDPMPTLALGAHLAGKAWARLRR